MQLHRTSVALSAALCAVSLSLVLVLAPVSAASGPTLGTLPGGCAAMPSWIAAASLGAEAQSPLPSCFSGDSSQAEALLSVANNRPYAQLISVTGGVLDLAESSFASPLAGALSAILTRLSPTVDRSDFLLGPAQKATLAIDRPAPGAGQQIHIDPVGDNAFAVAAVTWRLLSTATERGLLSAAIRDCVARVLHAALRSPPAPEHALRRVHACVNEADIDPHADALLRGLASRLLRDEFFQSVIEREATEPSPVRIALAVAASNPNLINPAILLAPANVGAVTAGVRTVGRLTASGGVPPYRFYLVPEPGGPGVPSWLQLAPDGTLILEPPPGAGTVALPVEVVDSTGEHSVVAY